MRAVLKNSKDIHELNQVIAIDSNLTFVIVPIGSQLEYDVWNIKTGIFARL